MARSRAQRRRRNLWILLGLVVVLVIVFTIRDISRVAHQAPGPRRSENRTFGALADTLLHDENQLNAQTMYLLAHGSDLKRTTFVTRLQQLDMTAESFVPRVQELSYPHLAHHVNDTLIAITERRVAAFAQIVSYVESVAGSNRATSAAQPVIALDAIDATNVTWNKARLALAKEPGRVRLLASQWSLGSLLLTGDMTALTSSATLGFSGGVTISALEVVPAPLPSPTGEILIAPTSALRLGLSMTNTSDEAQAVTVRCLLVPQNGLGRAQSLALTTTIGGLASRALDLSPLAVVGSERAQLVVDVVGAPLAPGGDLARHYLVVVSPSVSLSP